MFTAGALLQQIARRRNLAAVGELADLDGLEHAVLLRSLQAVPGKARVDLPLLLQSVLQTAATERRREAERQRTSNPLSAFRFQCELVPLATLQAWQIELRSLQAAGTRTWRVPGSEDWPAGPDTSTTSPATDPTEQPDPDLTDTPRQRRGSVPRLRPRPDTQDGPGGPNSPARTPTSANPASPASGLRERSQKAVQTAWPPTPAWPVGGKGFYGDGGVTGGETIEFATPPWILPDTEDEEAA